jgi:signal transduction histidine kinase/ActR/RegA family two-component response regulator
MREVQQPGLKTASLRLAENGLIITDRQGGVIHMGEGVGLLLGYGDAVDPVGTAALLERIQFAEGTSLAQVVAHALEHGTWHGEAAGVSRDNSAVLLDVEARRVDAGSHGDIGAVVVLRDATRNRMMEKQVLESQQMELVEKVSRGFVHEFRNLLTVISAHAELIRMTMDGGAEEETERIVQTCERATELTRRLSDMTRRLRPDMQDLDVDTLLAETCAVVAKAVPPQVTVSVPEAAQVPAVRADRPTLIRALMHLCLNGADAMPEGGTLSIDANCIVVTSEDLNAHPTREPGAFVVLEVTDRGYGMSPSARSHLYEPFFTTKKQGTGLGLYAVRQAVTAMGGELGIYTESGYGTCVKIYLPVTTPTDNGNGQARAATGGPPRTVLVVDDDPAVCQAAVRILEQAGHKVLTASEGEEAVDQFKQRADEVDVVLVDVVMPGIGGEGIHREAPRLKPGVGLVVMSGFPRRAAEQILETEVVHFVAKPFTRQALLEAVATSVPDA